jgi:hypothetical protein
MSEPNSPPKVPWSLAKKILLIVAIGVAGVSAALLGTVVPGIDFGLWMLGVSVVIALSAVAFLWNATPSSDTMRD